MRISSESNSVFFEINEIAVFLCFFAIPDAKPLHIFAGIALDPGPGRLAEKAGRQHCPCGTIFRPIGRRRNRTFVRQVFSAVVTRCHHRPGAPAHNPRY
ncbi:hypothetical protein [Kumtagia ephedrae]|uniref:hypothetical protein n=1 Tax=Kumtagia ephedrae TaxID=2116701 RepID=UPI001056FBD8|nr:hypothetical protein [Mesorhizobium ephedrae]